MVALANLIYISGSRSDICKPDHAGLVVSNRKPDAELTSLLEDTLGKSIGFLTALGVPKVLLLGTGAQVLNLVIQLVAVNVIDNKLGRSMPVCIKKMTRWVR